MTSFSQCHRRPGAASIDQSRGFILVSVLWLAGILAAVSISVSLSVRSHALYARNATAIVLAQGIADGLVRLTALEVSAAGIGGAARMADGSWVSCRWNGYAVAWISVQDQSGLVDLNTASEALMTALFEGLGLGSERALEMTAALRDYRDADSVSRLGGLEPATYPGRPFGPKNAPFEVVEELDQIPGMTAALFAELRPLTTVASHQPGFDFATAPERLLHILGLTRTGVAGLSFMSPRGSAQRSIIAAVQLRDGTRFVRHAVFELTDQPRRPFIAVSWDAGSWPRSEGLAPDAGTSCI